MLSRTEQFAAAPPVYIEVDRAETVTIETGKKLYALTHTPASALDRVLIEHWVRSEPQAYDPVGNTFVLPNANVQTLQDFPELEDGSDFFTDCDFASVFSIEESGPQLTVTVSWNPDGLLTPDIPKEGDQIVLVYRAIAAVTGAKLDAEKVQVDLTDVDWNRLTGTEAYLEYRTALRPALNQPTAEAA